MKAYRYRLSLLIKMFYISTEIYLSASINK